VTPKLLLADDSVTIQRVIELTFADENVQVVAVGDGKQAIDRVLTDRPDIVLADVGMPERDGYEVAAFIKGQPQLAHIPVLLLTGAFEPIDEARARSVGCDGVLVKPFEPQMVISRVRDLLSGRRAPAQPVPAPPAPADAQHASPTPAPAAMPDAGHAGASPGGQGASLEDYFDRLDAALATLGPGTSTAAGPPALEPIPQVAPPAEVRPAAPPAQPAAAAPPLRPSSTSDPLGGWDPDLIGGPPKGPVAPAPVVAAAPRPVEPVAPPPTVAPVHEVAPSGAAVQVPAAQPSATAPSGMPSLTDAFAALLAAEQGHPVPPAMFAAPAAAAPVLSDEMVEDIVRRVIARMGDESMRRAVLDTAERLVREEIDRIKHSTR
jgi:CheY-like chemotaxis protein